MERDEAEKAKALKLQSYVDNDDEEQDVEESDSKDNSKYKGKSRYLRSV